jgi:putative CocE/NonD family hydrolase
MGSDKWIYGPSYPLPQTRFEKLYLSSGGVLSFKSPDASQLPDKYTYDPGDPTPEGDMFGEHRLEMEQRKDLLIYTTAPFEKPYTFAGPVSAVLYAASSARDTDWFVHLLDIDEKGKPSTLWANASGGHIRARYRNALSKPELLVPGKTYEYKIDLWQTALTVLPGHRLRIEVMSAGFPAHDRNLNTGGNNETEAMFVKAYQTIYHDAARPSHILLPAIDH